MVLLICRIFLIIVCVPLRFIFYGKAQNNNPSSGFLPHYPHYLKSLFQLDDSSDRYYNLRITSEKIRLRTIHTARTSVFATRCLSMYGPVIWNELSESLRCCVSSEDFKKQLKTYLFNIFEEETKH